MAIRTIFTRGYGNGVFNGTIPLVTLRGYVPSAILVPDVEGLEYTLKTGVLHYTLTDNVLKYELPENKLNYDLPDNVLDYDLPENKLHFTLRDEND